MPALLNQARQMRKLWLGDQKATGRMVGIAPPCANGPSYDRREAPAVAIALAVNRPQLVP